MRATVTLAVFVCVCGFTRRFINAVVHFCNITPDRAMVAVRARERYPNVNRLTRERLWTLVENMGKETLTELFIRWDTGGNY